MEYSQLLVSEKNTDNGLAIYLKPKSSFLISDSLVNEIRHFQNQIVKNYYSNPWDHVLYIVWCFHPGSITLKGLDFEYIYNRLARYDSNSVINYIDNAFELLFLNYVGFDIPVINCSIVERPFFGCTCELFFMNQINFFKSDIVHSPLDNNDSVIELLNIKSAFKKCYFPSSIYNNNYYYVYQNKDLDSMREHISKITYKKKSVQELESIKNIFNEKKDETLRKVFTAAAKDLQILSNLANFQKNEQKNHKYSDDLEIFQQNLDSAEPLV